MTTGQFVTYLRNQGGNKANRQEMLDLINFAQNEILSYDNNYTRTKPDPNLATTSGTYVYTLAASVRRVARVYTRESSNTSYNSDQMKYWNYDSTDEEGKTRWRVPVITIDAQTPDTAGAIVKWDTSNNPNTTTTTYFLEQYVWPTQLESESVALTIPDNHATKVLAARVMQMLEEREYGNSTYWGDKYDKYLKEFLGYANASSTLEKRSIQYREL